MYDYRCIIRRVVDGDTIDVDIDLGFDVWHRERVRVYGIDTPEVRGPKKAEGLVSAERVRELLPEGSQRIIQIVFDRRGKFGRVLADFVLDDGQLLTAMLGYHK